MSARRRLNARKHRRRHAVDVGDPVAHRSPRHPELASQQRPQPRLVEVAGRLRVRVDPATVERRPAPVGAEHDVGDEHVRVELRIAGARRPMPERRGDQPAPRDHVHAAAAAARHPGRPLDVAERLGDRPIVRVPDRTAQLVVADPEQHARRSSAPRTSGRTREPDRPRPARAARRCSDARRRARDRAAPRRPCRRARAARAPSPTHTPAASGPPR